jgi:hypothetical protein
MTSAVADHKLIGLEPDNLLAFLALLGLLRALEEARPAWRPRAGWTLDAPPVRPLLRLREAATPEAVCAAAAEGVAALARAHAFHGRKDLDYPKQDARALLQGARAEGGYRAALAAALMTDGALKEKLGKPLDQIEATPLCIQFGQGHQHFLERLAAVPNAPSPPPRGWGKKAVAVLPEQALHEALFASWERQDQTLSFRWDVAEDVRYALQFGDPSEGKNRQDAQHGANVLAAVGLSCLPVAPVEQGGRVRPTPPGGRWPRGGFRIGWPLFRDPISLPALIAALDLEPDAHADISSQLNTHRQSVGKFMSYTPARAGRAGA